MNITSHNWLENWVLKIAKYCCSFEEHYILQQHQSSTRSGYKITGLIFLLTPCGFGNSEQGWHISLSSPLHQPYQGHMANNVVAAIV
jgi:hypothetical protein